MIQIFTLFMRFIFNHTVVIILISILVGIIHIIPHILIPSRTSKQKVYFPIYFSELAYASQIKEVLNGNIFVGDPQLYEYRGTFPPIHPLTTIISVATIAKILGSIENALLVSDMVFPPILFLILFLFVFKITKQYYPSILVGLATIFFYPIITNIPPITPTILYKLINKLTLSEISAPLPFARTPNPQISFIILIIAIWALYNFWTKTNLKSFLLFTLGGMLLFSTYFYHATFFFFLIPILLLFACLNKDWQKCKFLLVALVMSAMVAMFYKHLSALEPQNATQLGAGLFHTNYIDWIFTARYGIAAIISLVLLKNISKTLAIFLFSICLSAIICVNYQLIFGWTISPGHWPQTTIEPLMVIVGGLILLKRLRKINIKVFSVICIIVTLIFAFTYQLKFVAKFKDGASITKDQKTALDWLKNNSSQDTVVLSLDVEKFLVYVPVLTDSNILVPIYNYHYASLSEVWLRLLYSYKLYGLDLDETGIINIPSALYSLDQAYNINKYKHFDLSEYKEKDVQRIKNCYPSICNGYYVLPKSIEENYRKLYKNIEVKNMPFKLDYIIYSDFEKKLGAKVPPGKLVFSSGDIKIFKLD